MVDCVIRRCSALDTRQELSSTLAVVYNSGSTERTVCDLCLTEPQVDRDPHSGTLIRREMLEKNIFAVYQPWRRGRQRRTAGLEHSARDKQCRLTAGQDRLQTQPRSRR